MFKSVALVDVKSIPSGWSYQQGDILVPTYDEFIIKYFIILGAGKPDLYLDPKKDCERTYAGVTDLSSDDTISKSTAEACFRKIGFIPKSCPYIFEYFLLFVRGGL